MKEHGALAGIQLAYSGVNGPNFYTREVPLAVGNLPNLAGNPFQCRAMDLQDIRDVRRWHRDAALRAKEAGFDIVYVYATHGYMLSQFLSKTMNHRSDAYGGSLENRLRLKSKTLNHSKTKIELIIAVSAHSRKEPLTMVLFGRHSDVKRVESFG